MSVIYKKANGTWRVSYKGAQWPARKTVGIVTKAEHKKVSKGMAMVRVHRIVGTTGTQITGSADKSGANQTRYYRAPTRWGYVTLDYHEVGGTWTLQTKYPWLSPGLLS